MRPLLAGCCSRTRGRITGCAHRLWSHSGADPVRREMNVVPTPRPLDPSFFCANRWNANVCDNRSAHARRRDELQTITPHTHQIDSRNGKLALTLTAGQAAMDIALWKASTVSDASSREVGFEHASHRKSSQHRIRKWMPVLGESDAQTEASVTFVNPRCLTRC